MKSSLFDNCSIACKAVGTYGFGHYEDVIETVERIKRNLK
jgi:hypothetical protein